MTAFLLTYGMLIAIVAVVAIAAYCCGRRDGRLSVEARLRAQAEQHRREKAQAVIESAYKATRLARSVNTHHRN